MIPRDRRMTALVVSVAVAAAGYLAFALLAGWDEVVAAVRTAGITPVLVAGALSLVNYLLRFVRWEVFLRWQGHRLPLLESFRIYLAGFALTTTPGKLGETIRTPLLLGNGVGTQASLAAFLGERLSDLLAVLLLALLAAAAWTEHQRLLAVAAAALGLAMIGLRPLAGAFPRLATLHTLTSCLSSVPLVLGLLLGLLAWFAEAFAFAYLLASLGHDVGVQAATFVYCFSLLVGAISFLPGGLGSAEATMAGLLVYLGLAAPVAAAATVLIRIMTLWFAVILGLLAISMRPVAPAPE